jgi:hypothetical protein
MRDAARSAVLLRTPDRQAARRSGIAVPAARYPIETDPEPG